MGHFIEKPSQVNSSMKMFIVLFLAAVAFAEPEAEAEADPAWFYSSGLPYSSLTRGFYNPVVYSKPVVYQKPVVPGVAPVAAPAVYTKPAVYTYPWQKPVVYQKPVVTNVSPVVSTYAAPAVAAPAQVVTNYKSPLQYTAHSTLLGQTLGLPKYIAKNGPVEHIVNKPEADPQLLLSNGVLPLSTGVLPTTLHASVLPAVPAVKSVHVASPLVKSVVTAPLAKSVVTAPLVKSVPVVSPWAISQKSVVTAPLVKSVVSPWATAPLVKSVATPWATGLNNVAITPFGATHPSNVGLCLNWQGQQVPCQTPQRKWYNQVTTKAMLMLRCCLL